MTDYVPLWERRKRKLSKRMQQIKDLQAQNYSYKEIQQVLGIAPGTINKFVYLANKRSA